MTYVVGDLVEGRDCLGRPFVGRVDGVPSPYSLLVDGIWTPSTLITGRASAPPPVTKSTRRAAGQARDQEGQGSLF